MAMEQTVLSFREYAGAVLNELTEQLRDYDKDHLTSGKLARLQFFNTRLKTLKQKLSEETERILKDNASVSYHNKLKKALNAISVECVNEYLYNGFVKDTE